MSDNFEPDVIRPNDDGDLVRKKIHAKLVEFTANPSLATDASVQEVKTAVEALVHPSDLVGITDTLAKETTLQTVDGHITSFASANHTDLGNFETGVDSALTNILNSINLRTQPTDTQNVNVVSLTGVDKNAGNVSAATLRVIEATDSLSNTLLNDIKTNTANIKLDADTVILNTDGIETLISTTNSTLSTIDGHVDGIEASVDGLEASVDGLEGLVGTTNSTLSTIDGRVDGLETLVTSTNTKLDTLHSDVTGTLTINQVASTGADAVVNTSAKPVMGMNFNGTTWDRSRSGITAPTSTLTGMQNTLPMGEYNSSAPTLTNGQVDNLQLTADGSLKVSTTTTAVVEAAKTSTISNYTIGTAAGTAVASNAARKDFFVQNLGTNPLFVKFGATASTSSFNVILAAATAQDNGSGGSTSWDGYTGEVSVAGTSPRFIAWERT